MATPAPSPLFMRMVNIWGLLAFRSDIDDIILEMLGRFSLEKIYSESDKETYQHLVVTLLAQLNAIFYIQRLSLPNPDMQVGSYLCFLASWEVILRSVEFVLQIVVEGRESLWESQTLRDKHLAELLLSALRVLTLHPKAPTKQRAKGSRDRFARIHMSLERIYDAYPGTKSLLLFICKEITNTLRTEPNALALPSMLRYGLPNLASELYPLADCLSPQCVSTIASQEGFPGEWLSQFLALRDVSQFVVGASVQYFVNRETRDVSLLSSSVGTRNAVLDALDDMRMPPHLSKTDLAATFSETFRVILPNKPHPVRRDSFESQIDESEMDAMDDFCLKLNNRQIVHRVSDRVVMHSISEITRSISLLDDPSGQFRARRPKLYVINCQRCHLAGDSQLRYLENFKFSPDPGEVSEIRLPPKSQCIQCGEDITIMREILLARQTWDLLKPLESSADTISVERHLPTQFQLAPPKADTSMVFHSRDSNVLTTDTQKRQDAEVSHNGQPIFPGSNFPDPSGSIPQDHYSPQPPSFNRGLDTPRTQQFPVDDLTSMDGAVHADFQGIPNARGASKAARESLVSPEPIVVHGANRHRTEKSTSIISFRPISFLGTRTAPLAASPERERPGWKSRLTGLRRDSLGTAGDRSSVSSTNLESQRLEKISLAGLASASKSSSKWKPAKDINVYLSQNSTHALFWTRSLIQLWDLETSPPTFRREITTESACVLAAVAKKCLAYIIGTRDQKLTLRIVNLVQPSAPAVEYRIPSSLWCRSITIYPKENFLVIGFENSIVRFFNITPLEPLREDRLHSRDHRECKECPPVDTLSFSKDGLVLLASTRNPRSGMIHIYSWRFPFLNFRELSSCRYRVPLHESEDNGVSSAIFRSGLGCEEDLICITTWTQSGVPVLIQPEGGHKSDIKSETLSRQDKLGSRIQCAAFSPSGSELAMVNEKGHLYHISSLNSNPMKIRRIATSKELTAKSDLFAMAFMTLPGEEVIVLAWTDLSKATGFVKKIPMMSSGDIGIPTTLRFGYITPKSELPADAEPSKPSPELAGKGDGWLYELPSI